MADSVVLSPTRPARIGPCDPRRGGIDMPANDMYLRVHASLPWGTGGLPAFPVSDPRRWQPGVELRTLPDGTPLLRTQLGDGIRVTRLSAPPASVEIRTAHRIMDAVMHQDGQVT